MSLVKTPKRNGLWNTWAEWNLFDRCWGVHLFSQIVDLWYFIIMRDYMRDESRAWLEKSINLKFVSRKTDAGGTKVTVAGDSSNTCSLNSGRTSLQGSDGRFCKLASSWTFTCHTHELNFCRHNHLITRPYGGCEMWSRDITGLTSVWQSLRGNTVRTFSRLWDVVASTLEPVNKKNKQKKKYFIKLSYL